MAVLTTTVAQQTPDPRAEYIKGLRALADILEAHPELPLPCQMADDAAHAVLDGGRR